VAVNEAATYGTSDVSRMAELKLAALAGNDEVKKRVNSGKALEGSILSQVRRSIESFAY